MLAMFKKIIFCHHIFVEKITNLKSKKIEPFQIREFIIYGTERHFGKRSSTIKAKGITNHDTFTLFALCT